MGAVSSGADKQPIQRVADAIDQRRQEVGLTVGEMVARSGVTAPGLKPLRAGIPRSYAERTKNGLCDALRWRRGSIDRLFAGETPDPSWEVSTDESAVLEALDNDPALTDDHRELVRSVYLTAVELSQRR